MQPPRTDQPDARPAISGTSRLDCQRLSGRVFTIGHSNHEFVRFGALLRGAAIAAIADVRSNPFSQWLPQYNQPELRQALERVGVAYFFLGDELGGRPRNRAVYDADGRVDYTQVRLTPEFHAGIERLLGELEKRPVALMCAEEDPLDCHRGLMICPALIDLGVHPRHLRGDGSIETTAELEVRLLRDTGVGAGMLGGLFAASITAAERAEILDEAYRVQAQRRAFRQSPATAAATVDDRGE